MKKEKTDNPPNIAFVGDGKPLQTITAQGRTFTLPEDQSKPFYSEHARFVIQHFPQFYKPVREKGA